jgi:hypothetical protein
MGKLNYICLISMVVTSAFGQSAANFDTKIITPASPATKVVKTPKPAAEKEAKPSTTLPSRYVGAAEQEAYLATLSSVFLSGAREKDPFGRYQDPDAKPVVKPTVVKGPVRAAPAKATPLSEIIQLITISTIMPGDKTFLVGTRLVKQGEELSLVWRGKQIRVQVTDVTSRLIAFKNVETNETGTRQLDMLPPGMRAGNGPEGIRAPGMIPDRPNAPIELDAGEATP